MTKCNREWEAVRCYDRASTFIKGYGSGMQHLLQNETIFPVWIAGTNCFWYERAYKRNDAGIVNEYRLVDARASTNEVAFHHEAFAEALSQAANQAVNVEELPISHVSMQLSPLRVLFRAFDKSWQFDGEQQSCEEIPSPVLSLNEVLSPDGRQMAFIRDHNLWLRVVATGEERALTDDGEDDCIYCVATTVWGTSIRRPRTPAALWSPNGRRVLTARRDRRQVKTLPMIDYVPKDGSLRPQLTETKVAYPGDEYIETWLPLSIDVTTGEVCEANYPVIPAGFSDYFNFWDNVFWWAADGRRAYFIAQERGDRVTQLVAFDTKTGATSVVFEEVSDSHVNIVPDSNTLPLHRYLPKTNELLWWSERSGWGHLYCYDLSTGKQRAITSGDWRVRDVIHIDESRYEVWLQSSGRTPGRDPYYRDICRVNMDTGELTSVYSADEEVIVHYPTGHSTMTGNIKQRASSPVCGVSPEGEYVVATRTRADAESVTVLMDREGKQLFELERADIFALPEGWQWPEPFKVKAGDGETDLYGLMFRPAGFSSDKSYPILNFIHGAPWVIATPKASFHSGCVYADRHYFYGAALAELGFIVILMDGRGTPGRSKAFLDESYGWIPDSANRNDHISGLKQLAERFPFMDMDRVGVFGTGYRSSLQQFLECQDVYKVCVQMSVLDNRFIGSFEGDMWQGVEGPPEDRKHPEQLVENLQGKLMLMHAMSSFLSPAYPPAGLFRMVDALEKANKDFDMLVMPHGDFMCNSYMFRRAWDYLVRHLLKAEPPKEYDLGQVNM